MLDFDDIPLEIMELANTDVIVMGCLRPCENGAITYKEALESAVIALCERHKATISAVVELKRNTLKPPMYSRDSYEAR